MWWALAGHTARGRRPTPPPAGSGWWIACDPPRGPTQGPLPRPAVRCCREASEPRNRAPRCPLCGHAWPSPEGRPTTATHGHRICGIRHARHCASGSGCPGSLHIRADGESPVACVPSAVRLAGSVSIRPVCAPPPPTPGSGSGEVRKSGDRPQSNPVVPAWTPMMHGHAAAVRMPGAPALSGTFGQLCAGVSFQPVMCACGRVSAAFARPGVFGATGG